MAENLKTTRYCNHDLIGTTTMDISLESEPKYQWAYNGIESNVPIYGRLYTWHAINDSRKICPNGWHVPTDAEWTTLTEYLSNNDYGYGGDGVYIGKSLAATSGWVEDDLEGAVGNDQASNNSSGFTALPGGYRTATGASISAGWLSYWWSSTEYNERYAWSRGMFCYAVGIWGYFYDKKEGISVRCLKD